MHSNSLNTSSMPASPSMANLSSTPTSSKPDSPDTRGDAATTAPEPAFQSTDARLAAAS